MRRLALACLLLAGLAQPALAQPAPGWVEVRVLERRLRDTLELAGTPPGVAPHGPCVVEAKGASLRLDGRPSPERVLLIGDRPDGVVELRVGSERRRYPGRVRLFAEAGRLVVVNEVPIERYVAGVVSAEMPADWPLQAKMAQAVLARTLAVRGGAHPGHALCDLTHCQAYAGLATGEAVRAAEATRGRILSDRGAPIRVLYHSTCAGQGADSRAVFGGPPVSYLLAQPDPYCAASPFAAPWRVRIAASRVAAALGRDEIDAVSVRDRAPGGWVGGVEVDGTAMTGYRFWQALGRHLGWGLVKSLNFDVRREGASFVFVGKGLGHGVGLCQWGARARARAGWDWRRILSAYYPGTRVVGVAP
ncbi:MAG TPA: SpoIID/LytB domain-containing protein [Pantanalinema sp.]